MSSEPQTRHGRHHQSPSGGNQTVTPLPAPAAFPQLIDFREDSAGHGVGFAIRERIGRPRDEVLSDRPNFDDFFDRVAHDPLFGYEQWKGRTEDENVEFPKDEGGRLRVEARETFLIKLRDIFFAGHPARFLIFAAFTFVLGAAFLTIEVTEFASMVAKGAGPSRSAFLSAFFTLVGTHGVHVGTSWSGTCPSSPS
jgi:hypothetical protein